MDLHQIHTEDVFGPLDEFEGQGQRSSGTKRHFSALWAACVRFMFGKTSLASSFVYFWHSLTTTYVNTFCIVFVAEIGHNVKRSIYDDSLNLYFLFCQ